MRCPAHFILLIFMYLAKSGLMHTHSCHNLKQHNDVLLYD
jgi:hypothetical protein